MKNLSTYIKESYDDFLKLSPEDKKRLLDLDLEYGELMLISRYETYIRNINNRDEEWEKFNEKYIKNGEKYYPTIKHNEMKYEKYDLEKRASKLIDKFKKLNKCILSKYYIECLESIIANIHSIESVKQGKYELSDEKKNIFDEETLNKAFDIVHNEPFKKKTGGKYEKNIDGKEAHKRIKAALEELGYDWKIIINNDMPPRMGVNPEKTFRLKETAKFSEVDIQSLIAHEIKGHVQRRYWGYQNGLFLFVFGLIGRNEFDEGMAIWNSRNIVDNPKPNFMANIAFSYLSCYYCSKYGFCEAFDRLKNLYDGQDISDKKIFNQLMRSKRSTGDTKLPGFWRGDVDYFRGYLIVDEMTTEERTDIMRWNVGREQFYMIPTFKKFIKINNFSPISDDALNKIKKNYPDLPQ